MPCVQQTAACRSLRPVAKALGLMVGAMYMRGIGLPALADSSRTILYSIGASCSETSRACIEAMASLSENQ